MSSRGRRTRSARAFVALGLLCAAGACADTADGPTPADTAPTSTAVRAGFDSLTPTSSDPSAEFVKAFRGAGGHLGSVRERCHATLAEHGVAANGAAEQALASDERALRLGAAAHLARHGTPESTDALLGALATAGRGDAFRAEVISALGHVATPECVNALVVLIEADHSREAFLAARQLADSGAALPRERLHSASGMGNPPHMRASALMALGPDARPDEGDIFRAGAVDFAAPIRMCAVEGLARMPDVSRAEMSDLVGDKDDGVRLATLGALRSCTTDWVAAVATPALDDHDDDVQCAAIRAIAARPDLQSYEVLLAVLTNEKQDDHVRGAAARGLLKIDPTRGVGAVELLASADTGGARLYCRDALEQLPHADR